MIGLRHKLRKPRLILFLSLSCGTLLYSVFNSRIQSNGSETSGLAHEHESSLGLRQRLRSLSPEAQDALQHVEPLAFSPVKRNPDDPCYGKKDWTFACEPDLFLSCIAAIVCLILTAGMMAGLTMGLLSLDTLNLSILKLEGEQKEKEAAEKVLPIIANHHLLLVTLLLWNSFANEALPIFLDKVTDEYSAILISMTCVLFFGEIIPAAFFTGPRQLFVAAKLCPLVQILLFLTFPVAYPIGKALDLVLGHSQDMTRYKRNELKALVAMQKERMDGMEQMLSRAADHSHYGGSPRRRHSSSSLEESTLNVDEVTIIHGALDMAHKTVRDAMVPWKEVFTLDANLVLDDDLMAKIMSTGHSRIPIYMADTMNIRGLLLVKKLIVVDPDDKRKIGDLALRRPILTHPKAGLYTLLNRFQTGKSHMALVTENVDYVKRCWAERRPIDPEKVTFEGIITIEDVIEELIQEEIEDESDLTQDICEELTSHKVSPEATMKVVLIAVEKFKALLRRAKRRKEEVDRLVESVEMEIRQNESANHRGRSDGQGYVREIIDERPPPAPRRRSRQTSPTNRERLHSRERKPSRNSTTESEYARKSSWTLTGGATATAVAMSFGMSPAKRYQMLGGGLQTAGGSDGYGQKDGLTNGMAGENSPLLRKH